MDGDDRVISMKTTLLMIGLGLGMLQFAVAGGNSSMVEITKVTSIEIEDGKIIIKGDGMLRKRVMSDAEHGDSTAFGQPTQLLHARTRDGVFEIVPYNSRFDIFGVPGGIKEGDEIPEEMKARNKEHFDGLIAIAKQVKVGDAVTIGYQREKMTITGVYVTHIVGAGSLRIVKGAE
ncbi:MAG: hypothetical protein ACI8UO_004483 [Verrucomicrobiales bacterium]